MKNKKIKSKAASGSGEDYELRPRYDLSGSMPNKFAARYARENNVVLLEPEIAKVFRDSESVNRVLRPFVSIFRGRKASA